MYSITKIKFPLLKSVRLSENSNSECYIQNLSKIALVNDITTSNQKLETE